MQHALAFAPGRCCIHQCESIMLCIMPRANSKFPVDGPEHPQDHSHHSWMFFAFLLLVFTTYGMAYSDHGILDNVFELVRTGLFAGLGFEVGRRQ